MKTNYVYLNFPNYKDFLKEVKTKIGSYGRVVRRRTITSRGSGITIAEYEYYIRLTAKATAQETIFLCDIPITRLNAYSNDLDDKTLKQKEEQILVEIEKLTKELWQTDDLTHYVWDAEFTLEEP